jgi:hypothetical protein
MRAIFRLIFEQVKFIINNCTLLLFKDQPEEGPTIGTKHIAGIMT